MTIRLIEGTHLTATNKRHLSQMIGAGMASGISGPLSYQLEAMPDCPDRFRYTLARRERDDSGRSTVRRSKGVIEYRP